MAQRFVKVTKNWRNGDNEAGLFINANHIVKMQRLTHEGHICTRIYMTTSSCVTIEVLETPEMILEQLNQ